MSLISSDSSVFVICQHFTHVPRCPWYFPTPVLVICNHFTRARKHHNELINARESPVFIRSSIPMSLDVLDIFWLICQHFTRARKHHNELINARESPAQVKKIIETSKINMMYFVWVIEINMMYFVWVVKYFAQSSTCFWRALEILHVMYAEVNELYFILYIFRIWSRNILVNENISKWS